MFNQTLGCTGTQTDPNSGKDSPRAVSAPKAVPTDDCGCLQGHGGQDLLWSDPAVTSQSQTIVPPTAYELYRDLSPVQPLLT